MVWKGLTNIDQEWKQNKNWNIDGILVAVGCNLTNLNSLELSFGEL